MREKPRNNLTPLEELVKAYWDLGFVVLPAQKKTKRPVVPWREYTQRKPSLEEVLKLFKGAIEANLTAVCGRVSALLVLDIDQPERFREWLEKRGHTLEELLSLPSVIKTGKGYHVWFRHPQQEIGLRRFPRAGFELRGDGGVVVIPPSLHPDGDIYYPLHLKENSSEALINWLRNLELPEVPDWLLEEVEKEQAKAVQFEEELPVPEVRDLSPETTKKLIELLVSFFRPHWVEGARHELACGLSGWLVRLGIPQEVAERVVDLLIIETEDEEPRDRFRAVQDMYKNFRSGGKVKGLATIWNICGEEKTRELAKAVYSLLEEEEKPLSEKELEQELSSAIEPVPFPFEKFPAYFKRIVEEFSNSLNVPPEYTASAILTIFSAMVGNALWVAPKADWRVPPFLWLAVVQETGQGKTPVLRELMRPLKRLQNEAWETYQRELKEWKNLPDEDRKRVEAPKLRHYYAEDFTVEALADIFAQDSRGVLVKRDELAGLLLSLGQYKKRTADDRQRLLELWDCEPWKVDRRGRSLYIERTGASILGTIQPQILGKIFKKEHFDEGLIPRFLWLILPARPRYWKEAEISEQARAKYARLLKWARSLPEDSDTRTVIFSSEAKEKFIEFHDELERLFQILPYPLRAFVPKLKAYALKFALLHHLLKEAERMSFIYDEDADTG